MENKLTQKKYANKNPFKLINELLIKNETYPL
jgi:hypothetical protein